MSVEGEKRMRERWARQDRIKRWVATASTWAGKAASILQYTEAEGEAMPYESSKLLYELMNAADSLVDRELLDQDSDFYFDLTLMYAERVVAALLERRGRASIGELIAKLENVTGRTPEEAALFRRKAADLRASLTA